MPASLAPSAALRALILARRKQAHLSQKRAALLAGVTEAWWQRVETGAAPRADADTIARMCYAIDASPEQLDAIGEHTIADAVAAKRRLLAPVADADEAAIESLPLATRHEKEVLIDVLRALRRHASHEVSAPQRRAGGVDDR